MACGIDDAATSKVSTVFSDRERGGLEPVRGVRGVPGGDFGLDQGAEHLLRGPPLGFRGDQHLGGDPADRGQFQPAEPGRRGRPAAPGRRPARPAAVAGAAVMGSLLLRCRGCLIGWWPVIAVAGCSRPGTGLGATGQVDDQGATGGDRGGCAGAGGQDGPDVGGAEPAERDRPGQRIDQGSVPCAAPNASSTSSSRGQPGVPDRGGADEERLRGRAERAELLLGRGFRAAAPGSAPACGPS